MRLPRNLKMLRGPVDSAAVAGTLLLLWIVTLLHSSLVLPPGVQLDLPPAADVWGQVIPQLAVAVDPAGRLLYEHQWMSESNLQVRLVEHTARVSTRQTLLVLADRTVPTETLARLITLARNAGIREVVLGTSPRPGSSGNGTGGSGSVTTRPAEAVVTPPAR